MNSLDTLVARIARLEATEAIRVLKARYAALADQKYTADYARQPADRMARVAYEQAACFTDDAVWSGGNGFGSDLIGRSALEGWFRQSPWRFASHFYTAEDIEVVDDTTAQARWRLWQIALRDDDAHAVLLAAVTTERYARGKDGQWRISFMRFDELQMLECGAGPLPLASTFKGLDAVRLGNLKPESR
jgi:hypothetical protein